MAENQQFQQPAIPKFDGYYEHWAMIMENLVRSNELWNLIEDGVTIAPPNATAEQLRTANETKDIRDAMARKYQGSTKYFARTLAIVNRMTAHGERMEQVTIVEKILRSMPPKFNYVVCSIEQSNDVTSLYVDELQSSLIVQEQRMKIQKTHTDEQALKITNAGRGFGRGRGRTSSRGRGRGKQSKENIECFRCHKLGHYQSECPSWEDNANYAEFHNEEETLCMAQTDHGNAVQEEAWYLDSGCSNHMIDNKDWLFDFDGSFRDSVKLGNDAKMTVMGKGNVKLFINGKVHVISNVYYLPGLNTNLLSIGQLQQKNVTIIFKNDTFKGYHDEKAPVIMPMCLQVSKDEKTQLWHNRYGHLSEKGLKLLAKKEMVKGLPELGNMEGKCSYCIIGKQQRDAIPKQAKSPTVSVKNITPEEAWSGIKPSVHHFRVFGCLAYAHIPDNQRKKLNNKNIKCVLLGLSDESKAYKLYDPLERRIIVSRDVVFDESKGWEYDQKNKEEVGNSDFTNDISDDEVVPATNTNDEVIETGDVNDGNYSTDEDINLDDQSQTSEDDGPEPLQPRIRRTPGHLKDFVTGKEAEEDQELHNLAVYNNYDDPNTYDEASKSNVWRKAMDLEIKSIEDNNTWELTSLPEGVKAIGVKWIYKTKYNEQGKIEKYKARWDTIRTVLALAASKGWCVFQLDVKSAFLHGELTEDIYVEQPLGYQRGENNKVYKLRKALYGLKQAPRAWYSKIESYFALEKFEKCASEHTLFVKYGEKNDILIVSLYVDDLIFTSNNQHMITQFKESMMKRFAMTDLGKMKYFLGIEVHQTKEGIFITQMKFATEILKKFGMENCNKVSSPIVPGCKLVKNENGKASDAKVYKQMVGSLMYLLATRPDLAFSVCLVARFMERPTELHVAAIKRIMRYLKGSISFGILYKRNFCEKLQLDGWSDSNYAGDLDDRKSTSGYVFKLGTGAISWSSKKQPIVTLSTTEA
ncbi:hypothetical protein TSUD_151900 [Trifolium subterraneum]|uniref:CCHC-type domain-containing protein n=1 Tax=Trifolium subterraneum TaxID=3900 RepID=A0A2Z6P7N5_TRISU|nr:hypothetical protein TSUD_151900 [Trifolium subterraneum]